MERPAFVEVPVQGGGSITAVVASRDGIAEVEINGVPHIGLLLSVNATSATLAVLTPNEAAGIAQRLSIAAVVLARRLRQHIDPTAAVPAPPKRDVTGLKTLTRLHSEDIGAAEFEVLDQEGNRVEEVVEVNVEEGWIRTYARDEEGALMIENGGYVVIRVRGTYSIRRLDA